MDTDDDQPVATPGEDPLVRLFGELALGRSSALEDVFRHSARQLYGLALWRTGSVSDAEDAVQEVFLRLARRGGKLKQVREPRAYLLRMTRNAAADIASRRRHDPLGDEVPPLVEVDPLESRVDARRASALVSELPHHQREVVFLRDFAGLSFRQIAEVCGIPLFTAASRHRLAIRRLRQLMGVQP